MDHERIQQELNAVGCVCRRIVDGQPVVDSGDPDIAQACINAHIEDEAQWLATDLDADADDDTDPLFALAELVLVEEWEAYLAIQTNRIRELRYQAYTARGGINDYALEAMSDTDNYTDIKAEMKRRKDAIKAKYPWPGDYR
jgi:hypothetical protein